MAKVERTLVRTPEAKDIVALFEQLKGRKATAQEKKDIEAELKNG